MRAPKEFIQLVEKLCLGEDSFLLLTWESRGPVQRYTLSGEKSSLQGAENPFHQGSFEIKTDDQHGVSIYGELESQAPDSDFFWDIFQSCPQGELVLQRRIYSQEEGQWKRVGGYSLMKTHLLAGDKEPLKVLEAEETALMLQLKQFAEE